LERLARENTPTFYKQLKIMAAKRFITLGPGRLGVQELEDHGLGFFHILFVGPANSDVRICRNKIV
jgi:hypothetical protein